MRKSILETRLLHLLPAGLRQSLAVLVLTNVIYINNYRLEQQMRYLIQLVFTSMHVLFFRCVLSILQFSIGSFEQTVYKRLSWQLKNFIFSFLEDYIQLYDFESFFQRVSDVCQILNFLLRL